MRALRCGLLMAAAALSVAGCKCGKSGPSADAGTPVVDAGVAAVPLTPPMKRFRESDTAYQQGKPDDAIAMAREVVQEQPKNALAHNLIGRSFVAKFDASKDAADAENARVAFRKAFEVDPQFWPAMLNLAELEEKTGNLKAAGELYSKVLQFEPTHPERARFEAVIEKGKAAK